MDSCIFAPTHFARWPRALAAGLLTSVLSSCVSSLETEQEDAVAVQSQALMASTIAGPALRTNLASQLASAAQTSTATQLSPGIKLDPSVFETTPVTVRPELASAVLIPSKRLPRGLFCPPPAGTRPDPTLVNTDPFVLSRFPLRRVFDQLVSLSATGLPAPIELYQQMWDTLDVKAAAKFPAAPHCNDVIPPSTNGFPIECPRPESVLKNSAPKVFEPVALFNRFDLAPPDGAHCGEYRIVYAMTGAPGRNFVIFEGILPNPKPTCGLEACRPVVDFWEKMSSFDPTTAAGQLDLANALDAFYFKGLPGFEPVVHPDHYGNGGGGGYGANGRGQIRVNMFAGAQWQLREYVLTSRCRTGLCPLVLRPVTVKGNPFAELFDPGSALSRAPAFQAAFPGTVHMLSVGSLNQISMSIKDVFNAGESNAQNFFENYDVQLAPPNAFASAIAAASTDPTLTATDLAKRATTQSCAGCHQLSNGAALGGGLTWPNSLGFVHVDENSELSAALWCEFLPARKAVLDGFAASPMRMCPPRIITPEVRVAPVFVLDPGVRIEQLPQTETENLTVSGKIAGPN